MKLEQQVSNLELSQKLKELGVKQESYWHWYDGKGFELKPTLVHPSNPYKKVASAFTVAELGEMLPAELGEGEDAYYFGSGKRKNGEFSAGYGNIDTMYYADEEGNEHELDIEDADSEANARAKMLIYLIENNLIPN